MIKTFWCLAPYVETENSFSVPTELVFTIRSIISSVVDGTGLAWNTLCLTRVNWGKTYYAICGYLQKGFGGSFLYSMDPSGSERRISLQHVFEIYKFRSRVPARSRNLLLVGQVDHPRQVLPRELLLRVPRASSGRRRMKN